MRHRKKGKRLNLPNAKREALLKNLATSIILYEKIKTTEAKAKQAAPIVEKLINIGKKGNLSARRKLLSYLPDKNATEKILKELSKKYKNRPGGYTRIYKIGQRAGDKAKMTQIELV
jgi:large subunit ribosomal protein L17